MPTGNPREVLAMAQVKLVNYDEASAEVRAVFDDIMKTRDTDYINNIWRALAVHPPLLKRFWSQMKEVMVKPSRLDPLTKELIYLAVSVSNNCDYCIASHTFAARKHGLDDAMLGEFNEVVALANAGNRLTMGLQVEPDERFRPKYADKAWSVPARPATTRKAKRSR
jgi:AhpD family alkylhydroperoxidase